MTSSHKGGGGGRPKVTKDDEGEGGGQCTPQKWWRHLWTAPYVRCSLCWYEHKPPKICCIFGHGKRVSDWQLFLVTGRWFQICSFCHGTIVSDFLECKILLKALRPAITLPMFWCNLTNWLNTAPHNMGGGVSVLSSLFRGGALVIYF